ncbi:MAG: hypothetical protein K2G89_04755 [Lachnospiraceae bacterium]|nr:hypothetical protein [Lachnospiraceae bacterium]
MGENYKIVKHILMICIVMLICCHGGICVSAAGRITGVCQSGDGLTTASVTWLAADAAPGAAFGVYLYDNAGNLLGYQVASGEQAWFNGLQPGTSYYVQVVQLTVQGEAIADTMSDKVELVTRPDISQAGLVQQGQTENSVSILLQNVSGANQYTVNTMLLGVEGAVASQVFGNVVMTLPILENTAAQVAVYPQRAASTGYVAVNLEQPLILDVYVIPSKVQEVYVGVWYPTVKPKGTTFPGYKSNKVCLEWQNNNYADGYQVIIYDLSGKKRKTYEVSAQSETYCKKEFTLAAIKNKGFMAEVSAYKVIGGQKCYGICSEREIVLPQATVTKITGTAKKRTIYWKKVANASKYVVYRVRKGKLKAIKTFGKGVVKYTVKNLKSGDGLAVAAKVKVNGKWHTSSITWYISQY